MGAKNCFLKLKFFKENLVIVILFMVLFKQIYKNECYQDYGLL